MKTILSIATVISTLGGPMSPFQDVEDISSLPFLNPDLSLRKTAKLRLPNGLEALLISDPNADQSAAAVAVRVGSWNDPLEYPGMAHFCEHMLFMGTEKYPSKTEFDSLISDYTGTTNAFTAPDRTVYMFACQPDGFLPLLDRFAHFFIDPIFNPANIAREMHAVDQENAKNIENDAWREYMVFKETGNPTHPNRMFSTGNSKTLSKIPQSALKKWHRQFYGADRMHLAIYSPLDLETLKEKVVQSFTAIPRTLESPPDHNFALTSQQQKGRIIYIKPIQNRRLLTLSWELPQELSNDDTKSAEVLAYALQRGQKYSLYEKLKEEQLIDGMVTRADDLGGKDHQFFQITLELTQKGVEQMETAVLRVYQALAGIKATGVPSYLFEEKNAIAQLNYQYQSRQNAFDYIMRLADSLPEESLSSFPRNTVLASEYSPQKIAAAAAFLTPESCLMSFMASPEITKVPPEKTEKWSGAEYAIRSIPEQWLLRWNSAVAHSEIRLAEPNPYLPTRLEVIADSTPSSVPIPIADTDLGIAYYIRSPEYATPESITHLYLLSPEINASARSSVLTSLYIDHLTDVLNPTLSAATSAGLNCRIEPERNRIHIQISGYSEKAPLLLQEVTKQMPLTPPTPEQFAIYAARHEKDYANSQKELAVRQAKELLDTVINQDKTTKREKLTALKTIRFEDFLDFHKRVFEKTYIEGLFSGNLSLKDAESAWLDVMHVLGRNPYPKEEHPATRILHLPEQSGPYSISQNTEVQGNAAILLVDEGPFSFEKRAAQEILTAVLKESFFNELRTRQKTGYLVQSDCTEIEEHLFGYFLVQSNSHHPEELLYRFEHFIEEFNETLVDHIPLERFETLKQNIALSLKTRFRNLKDKTSLWDLIAFQHDADFAFLDKRIAAFETLTYDNFLGLANSYLTRENRKRLAVLFEGKLAAPFAYEPIGVRQLDDIARYANRKENSDLETAASSRD